MLRALVLLAALWAPGQGTAPAAPVPMKTVDTGAGLTVSVPESWVRTRTPGHAFAIGAAAEDFSLVVSDLGPATGEAGGAWRSRFERSGFKVERSADVVVAGAAATRYELTVPETSAGSPGGAPAGRADVVLVPVRGRMLAVMVATPSSSYESRKPLVGRILDSLRIVAPAS